MSRFFKSAAFPILIVIVLAFFASKLIQQGNAAPATSYQQFLNQIDNSQIDNVVLRTKDYSAEVTLKGSFLAWTLYREGRAADYLRNDVDATLEPYLVRRRKRTS